LASAATSGGSLGAVYLFGHSPRAARPRECRRDSILRTSRATGNSDAPCLKAGCPVAGPEASYCPATPEPWLVNTAVSTSDTPPWC